LILVFFSLSSMVDKPRNVKEALNGDEALHRKQAMEEEMKALEQNHTLHLWELCEGSWLGCEWALKKYNENGCGVV
jgi:hypothetical protein